VNSTLRKARPAFTGVGDWASQCGRLHFWGAPVRAWAVPAIAAALVISGVWSQRADAEATAAAAPLPQHLSETGLYVKGSSTQIDPQNVAFSPQYPLWSDGTRKRRWIYLPPGATIDASKADAWEFPTGTRLWKEFALDRRVETRFIERLPDGAWRFAAYVWNEDGTDATLAPADGIAALPIKSAPHGAYAIPRPTAARVTKAPRSRCWVSAHCSYRPIATPSRRMPMRARISTSGTSPRADSSRISTRRCFASRRASR
jgi:hypothetical protein